MLKWVTRFVLAILIFTTPVFCMSSAIAAANTPISKTDALEENVFDRMQYISYDQILELLEAIENDKLEELYNPKEVARIVKFIAYIAQKGSLFLDSTNESLEDLESDTEELLSDLDDDNPLAWMNRTRPNTDFSYSTASISDSTGRLSYAKAGLASSSNMLNILSKNIKKPSSLERRLQ